MKNFVKLKIKVPGGYKTYWAEKLSTGRYREVNKDGEWGFKGKVHYIATSQKDIVWEKPAKMNPKYATLELESRRSNVIKLADLIREDSAGEEAKKRGLVHISFGRYADPSNPKKVVAKSVNGKLVRVDPQKDDEDEDWDQKDVANYDDEDEDWDQKDVANYDDEDEDWDQRVSPEEGVETVQSYIDKLDWSHLRNFAWHWMLYRGGQATKPYVDPDARRGISVGAAKRIAKEVDDLVGPDFQLPEHPGKRKSDPYEDLM